MDTSNVCTKCGKKLSHHSHGGLCPICQMEVAIFQGQQQPPDPHHLESESKEQFPRTFGAYELLEQIGHGGMGVVYKARQTSLNRIVAIKMILAGELASKKVIDRFKVEAEAAGHLHHPNIVSVYATGEADGQLYFSMEYVEGRNLSEIMEEDSIDSRKAAQYVACIARAIDYAHQNGILHRDLKPSNVLIDAFDQPRVTDFGLAGRLESGSSLTLSGQLIGSPDFIPPEQAASDRGKIGPWSDVHGLGGILYFLLTRRPPYQAATLQETLKQVFEKEPKRPGVFNEDVPVDLDTICMKCLEKEPDNRYQNAREVAEELERFLDDRPIHARPIGQLKRAKRWAKRNPALAVMIVTANVLLIALTILGFSSAQREKQLAENERQSAEKYRSLAYASEMGSAYRTFLEGNVVDASIILERHAPASAEDPDYREFTWRYLNYLCAPYREIPKLNHDLPVLYLDASHDGKWLAAGGIRDQVSIWDLKTYLRIHRFKVDASVLTGEVFFSADSKMLQIGGDWLRPQKRAHFRETENWNPVPDLPVFEGIGGGFSPDGSLFILRGHTSMQFLATTNQWKEFMTLTDAVDGRSFARFSPDNEHFLTGGMDRLGRLYETQTGKMLGSFTNHTRNLVEADFSPDNNWVASAGLDRTIRIWNIQDFKQEHEYPHAIGLSALDVSPDSLQVATGGQDGVVKLWDFHSRQIREFRGHSKVVQDVKFIPGANLLASGSFDEQIRLWPLESPSLLESFHGPRNREPLEANMDFVLSPIAISEDSQSIAFVRTIDPQWQEIAFRSVQTGVVEKRVATLTQQQRTILLSAVLEEGTSLPFEYSEIQDLALSSKDLLVVARKFAFKDDKTNLPTHVRFRIEFWDLHSGAMTNMVSGQKPLCFSQDGRRLAWQSESSGTIQYWDLKTGNQWSDQQKVYPQSPTPMGLAFSPDGALLAYNGYATRILKTTNKLPHAPLADFSRGAKEGPLSYLAFTPDGNLLIAGGRQGNVYAWDIHSHDQVLAFRSHADGIECMALSPDGRTLATGGSNGILKLWILEAPKESSGWKWQARELLTLKAHQEHLSDLEFSLDGSFLVSSGGDETIRIWHAPFVE